MVVIVGESSTPSPHESRKNTPRPPEVASGLAHIMEKCSCLLGPRRTRHELNETPEDLERMPHVPGLHGTPQVEFAVEQDCTGTSQAIWARFPVGERGAGPAHQVNELHVVALGCAER